MWSGLWVVAALGMTSAVPSVGFIEGHVRYPSCTPPVDLHVCAEALDGSESLRTRKLRFTKDGYAYAIPVSAGLWRVYAATHSILPGYRAYYSRAVRCGLSVECVDHTPIVVEVKAGEVVSGVDPDDWFDFTPIPRPLPRPMGPPISSRAVAGSTRAT